MDLRRVDLQDIRAALKKPGKSKSGLAKALGRQPSAVTALLNGGRDLKAREIPVVIEYLELAPALAPITTTADSVQAIARRLRLIRIGHGNAQGLKREMSQAEICRLTGIETSAWNNAETGDNRLGMENAIRLRQKTGATLDYIFLGDTSALPHTLAVEIAKLGG